MKRWTNLNATALLLLGLLAGPTSVARAGRDEIIVHEGGITFRVARYDDGRKKPYLLKFWASGVKTSKYRFKQDGRVGSIKAGTEKYSVWHKRNGSFKKVVRKDAGGRMLLGDENAEENQQIDQGGIDEGGQAVQFEHRRLYACDDCDEAWDIVCNVGVPTICNLRDNETLGTKGDSSVAIACETFGIACSKLSADEACDGQCIEEGTPAPTPSPTAAATPPPTKAPTLVPTPSPTQAPTPAPTPSPTKAPTPAPTPSPTEAPSPAPTPSPTKAPTPAPTPSPTPPPSVAPLSTDACTPNPCLNGGSCELDAGGGHVCTCTSGYGGMACQIDASSLSEFYITMDFEGTWTPERQAVFQSAAGRWAEVVTHVPCGGSTQYPAGQLLITATLEPIDGVGNVLGSAGPTLVWNACNTISLAGSMTFDIDDIQDMEDRNIFEGVILHEMGHVVGVGSLWGDCSTCRSDSDTNWKCPSTVEVYNDLLGDPEGTDADIIELDGGVGTACGHFDEVIFDDELMTGFVDNVMYLSKVTAASLDDTGYTVDPSQVDPYTLPARRSVLSVRDGPERHLIEDIAIDTVIGVMDENGTIVGQLDSFVMQFS